MVENEGKAFILFFHSTSICLWSTKFAWLWRVGVGTQTCFCLIPQPRLLPPVIVPASQGGHGAWGHNAYGQHSAWRERNQYGLASFFL